jgi:hypothetical protein
MTVTEGTSHLSTIVPFAGSLVRWFVGAQELQGGSWPLWRKEGSEEKEEREVGGTPIYT